MASQESDSFERVNSQFEDAVVVDTDVHITYTEELEREVASRMSQPWANYVDPDKTQVKKFRRPAANFPKSLGGTKAFEITSVSDPETIQEDLVEGLGIDYPILNLLGWIDSVYKTDRALEEMRAVNDMLLDRFLDDHDNLLGLATISLRKPDRAAEEIDRIGDEDDIVGAFFYTGTQFQKPPGDPQYDVMYQALEDNDLTPTYHVSNFVNKAPILKEFETVMAWHSLGNAWSLMQAVVSLITQGTPEKFPDLNFMMVEGDIGWVPYVMARLNRERGQWQSEVPLLEKSPEEYIRDQFYFSTQPIGEFDDPANMLKLLEIIGPESLTFATDYPHYDFDNPSAIDTYLKQFSEEERERVLSRNAADAYGLDI